MEDTMSPRNSSGIVSLSGFMLLFGSLIAGGIILVISYVVSRLFRSRRSQGLPKSKESSRKEQNHEVPVPQQGGKKLKNRKRREPQQKFTHSWLVGSLRGHTDSVLDLHFSTNGKYVGTCAEAMICLDVNHCSYESSNKEPQTIKSDKLDDTAYHRNKLHWWLSWLDLPAINPSLDTRCCPEIPLRYRRPPTEENVRDRLKCSNLAISQMLARYILTPEQLSSIGYPVQCGTAVCPQYSMLNAVVNHVPYPSNNPQDKEPMFADNCYCTYNYAGTHCFSTSYKRLKCARCAQIFYLTQTNEYMWKDECVYHWGKFIEKTIDGCPVGVKIWSCCEGDATSPGCSMAKWHVWTGVMPGYNPLRGFMRSKKPKIHPRDGFYGIYGLDCEMCFTRNGLEIIQIAIVDMNGTAIYHSYVKPEAEVLDYNTRFSGITAGDLQGVEKTLSDVHRDIAAFIHEDTILIGHSLENDLRALRLLHKHCIDTSIVFPHYYGYPYRNSLKYLARRVLNRDIQEKIHDPAEDARTALDLMMIKLHSDSSSL